VARRGRRRGHVGGGQGPFGASFGVETPFLSPFQVFPGPKKGSWGVISVEKGS
jgi:hypothetical protein